MNWKDWQSEAFSLLMKSISRFILQELGAGGAGFTHSSFITIQLHYPIVQDSDLSADAALNAIKYSYQRLMKALNTTIDTLGDGLSAATGILMELDLAQDRLRKHEALRLGQQVC